MITISKTYEIITEESAEHGDAEKRGWVCKDSKYTFRELVDDLEYYPNPSCWPGVPNWASTYEEFCWDTGETYIESIHPGNDSRSQRYWAKAWNYVYGK